jgi:pyruvate/2-oxoglutarate dehydrogenase complex dihydrolipoamide dehydrogenase (E3) component
MSESFDVVILGAGPAGEVALNALLKAGQKAALVEAELIGGECTNWGCIPSKTLLRPPDLRGETAKAAGVETAVLDWPGLSRYRDYMVSNHDDSKRIANYEERGVTVLKDKGVITGPGRVQVGGRKLEAGAIIVATGADAVIPPIPGLAESGFWTNREVTALTEIPASVVFIGGGVVSVELGQFLARFGSRVSIVQGPPRLADREDPKIGELLGEILEADGVELVLGRRAVAVRAENGEKVVELDDGSEARGAELVVATGRRPRTQGIAAASPLTNAAAPARASGRSATSPASRCSPTSESTRAGSRRWTSSASRRRPTTALCRASSSPSRSWRRSGIPSRRRGRRASTSSRRRST